MLDTATKKRIDDCRDILVGKLPDPKAQIEQITIGLIYKFMDDMDKEAIELGGKAKFFANYTVPNPEFPSDRTKDILIPFEQYSWGNLFNAKVTAADMLRLYSEAIQGIDKNPNIPPLFRDIFKNAFLPYRDPETLKLFLKTIGEFEYTHSEKLGDAFEYLLSVMGSQGDAGQFRTPRHIIDFIVSIVDPNKKDKILDPACGTAGFLISAFKHIKEKNKQGLTPDQRKTLMQNFVGYDISPDMVRLSLVNLYLHGFSDPHIWEYDTLSNEERWDETFDVILANPPFMSPKGGIRPHKRFSISSNRSEVLFVDYIAEHLNPKGRAGIIVPEGVIFQSGTAYKDLRKMLVDNYLYAVVSLPAGVFNPYSGVKTSILLMDKEFAKKTKEILFVKINNDGYGLGAQRNAVKGGQLEEAVELIQQFKGDNLPNSEISHVISKKNIERNGDYNLSGERYKIPQVFISKFDLVKLGEICELVGGGTPSKSQDSFWDNGDIKWVSSRHIDNSGNIIGNDWITKDGLKNSTAKIAPRNSIIFITRVSVGKYAIANDDYAINQDLTALVPKAEMLSNKFLFALAPIISEVIDKASVGIGVRGITRKQLSEIEIPLPPLSIQEEIVAEIEGYQRVIDGAKAVVENYKPKIDIDPAWEMVELQEICEIKRGRFSHRPRNEPKFFGGEYPFIQTGDVVRANGGNVEYTQTLNELGLSVSKLFKPTIVLVTIAANIGDTAILNYEACFTDSVVGLIPNEKVNPYYLELIMRTQKIYLNNIAPQAAQKNINIEILKPLKIALPPISVQQEIVNRIEKSK